MSGRGWTPEQVKLAFHLYCQLPFGRLYQSNPEIISSGRKRLSGASKLDRAIWDEFHSDWEGLVLARSGHSVCDAQKQSTADG